MDYTQRAVKILGYEQISSLNTVKSLTVPEGTSYFEVIPQAQAVRFRADGTDPTATVGQPIAVGVEKTFFLTNIGNLKFIEQAASAVLNVTYYG